MLPRFIQSIFSYIDFPLGWVVVLGITLLDTLWMSNTWVKLPSPWPALAFMLIPFYLKGLYRLLVLANILVSPRIFLFFNRLLLCVEYTVLCSIVLSALCTLSYLACALNYPAVDQALSLMDQAIGFNWLQFFHLCHSQPIETILGFAYTSLIPQLVFFALFFSFLYQKDRLYEMFWLLVITSSILVFISVFLPAAGPATALGMESFYDIGAREALSDVAFIRSGVSPDFSTHGLGGIVAFPSFHTAAAILYIYGFRKSGVLGHIILLLNIVMLFSTPTFGDHYLVDMLAGAAIAILSIIGIRRYPFYRFSNVNMQTKLLSVME